MFRKYFVLLFLFFFSLACIANANILKTNAAAMDQNRKANNGVFNPIEFAAFRGYKGDGWFVEHPAYAGDVVGYVIGVLPAIVISEPFRLIFRFSSIGDVAGEYTLYGTTKTFGCLFGGPSYLLKGAFYDAPIWLYSSVFGTPVPQAPQPVKEPEYVPSTFQKQAVETPVSVAPVETKKAEPAITSISAKPSVLETQKQLKAKESTSTTEQQPPVATEPQTSTPPVNGKTIKKDKTSWGAPPPLPNWLKKEMKE